MKGIVTEITGEAKGELPSAVPLCKRLKEPGAVPGSSRELRASFRPSMRALGTGPKWSSSSSKGSPGD